MTQNKMALLGSLPGRRDFFCHSRGDSLPFPFPSEGCLMAFRFSLSMRGTDTPAMGCTVCRGGIC